MPLPSAATTATAALARSLPTRASATAKANNNGVFILLAGLTIAPFVMMYQAYTTRLVDWRHNRSLFQIATASAAAAEAKSGKKEKKVGEKK